MKITIIGAGNIGGAIARGLAKGHMFKAQTSLAQHNQMQLWKR